MQHSIENAHPPRGAAAFMRSEAGSQRALKPGDCRARRGRRNSEHGPRRSRDTLLRLRGDLFVPLGNSSRDRTVPTQEVTFGRGGFEAQVKEPRHLGPGCRAKLGQCPVDSTRDFSLRRCQEVGEESRKCGTSAWLEAKSSCFLVKHFGFGRSGETCLKSRVLG